tara:strand:- start:52 stop:456 length:405 start_codon:yes stop_codon:yes gene_type:complete
LESHKKYFHSPEDDCYVVLTDTLKKLNMFYEIGEILVNEVDNDVVLFNKTYNRLEDKGYFLNEIEKLNIKMLENISDNLVNINSGINDLSNAFERGFRQVNQNLEFINGELVNIDLSTSLNGDYLYDISLSLPN